MERTLQVKCPSCGASLKIRFHCQDAAQVSCLSCSNLFTARPSAESDATGLTPIEVTSLTLQSDAGQPLAHVTWEDAPVPSLKTTWPVSGSQPDVSSRDTPTLQQRDNSFVNLALVGLAVCILIPTGWMLLKLTRDSNLIGIPGFQSFTPETHEDLFGEFLTLTERRIANGQGPTQLGDLPMTKAEASEHLNESEALLLRAIRLGPGMREQVNSCRERFDAVMQLDGVSASETNSDVGEALRRGTFDQAVSQIQLDAQLASEALNGYVTIGIGELPIPDDFVEQIYYDEVDVTRAFVEAIVNVGTATDLPEIASQIERQADVLMDVAQRRSRRQNKPEYVDPIYLLTRESLSRVIKVLLARLERLVVPSDDFQAAVKHFEISRVAFADAANGVSASLLADRLSRSRSGPVPAPPTSKASLSDYNVSRPVDSSGSSKETQGTLMDDTFGPGGAKDPADLLGLEPGSPDGLLGSKGFFGEASRDPRARYSGPTAVRLVVTGGEPPSEWIRTLADRLHVREYLKQTRGARTTIGLRFSGPLEEVASLINFGSISRIDDLSRQIYVDMTPKE